MKTFLAAVHGLILTSATLTSARTNTENELECTKRSPSIMYAIGRFCQKNDLVVPSDYAVTGAHGTYNDPHTRTKVYITGSCKPPQWVPQEFCFSQFKELCADSQDKTFSGVEYFGRSNCQRWHIENGPIGPAKPVDGD